MPDSEITSSRPGSIGEVNGASSPVMFGGRVIVGIGVGVGSRRNRRSNCCKDTRLVFTDVSTSFVEVSHLALGESCLSLPSFDLSPPFMFLFSPSLKTSSGGTLSPSVRYSLSILRPRSSVSGNIVVCGVNGVSASLLVKTGIWAAVMHCGLLVFASDGLRFAHRQLPLDLSSHLLIHTADLVVPT